MNACKIERSKKTLLYSVTGSRKIHGNSERNCIAISLPLKWVDALEDMQQNSTQAREQARKASWLSARTHCHRERALRAQGQFKCILFLCVCMDKCCFILYRCISYSVLKDCIVSKQSVQYYKHIHQQLILCTILGHICEI